MNDSGKLVANFRKSTPARRPAPPAMARRWESGFTLIEVLVAIAILGLVAGMILSSFRMGLNSYKIGQERIEAIERDRVITEMIRTQISSIYPARPRGGFLASLTGTSASTVGQAGEIATSANAFFGIPNANNQFQAGPPLFSGGPNSITFVTLAPLDFRKGRGMAVVTYMLAVDNSGQLVAYETMYRGLEDYEAQVVSPQGKPVVLFDNVSELLLQYFGPVDETGDYRWTDQWDGQERQTMPTALSLEIKYDKGRAGRASKLVIPVNAEPFGIARFLAPANRRMMPQR